MTSPLPVPVAAQINEMGKCRETLWESVCRSPSVFGRLVAVAQLRNESGKYEYRPSREFGVALIDRTLRQMHRDVLAQWLSLPLRKQRSDLAIWLKWLGHTKLEGYRFLEHVSKGLHDFLPARRLEEEEKLFSTDFLTLLPMFNIEHDLRSSAYNEDYMI